MTFEFSRTRKVVPFPRNEAINKNWAPIKEIIVASIAEKFAYESWQGRTHGSQLANSILLESKFATPFKKCPACYT